MVSKLGGPLSGPMLKLSLGGMIHAGVEVEKNGNVVIILRRGEL